jgi:hypothetical protein
MYKVYYLLHWGIISCLGTFKPYGPSQIWAIYENLVCPLAYKVQHVETFKVGWIKPNITWSPFYLALIVHTHLLITFETS